MKTEAASFSQTIQSALQLHQAGQLAEAEKIYKQVLAVDPDNATVLHMLGVLSHQAGKHYRAVDLISRAVAANPADAAAFNNLGEAYRGLKRLEEAEKCYIRALAINPDFAMAYSNLGNTCQALGRPEEAERAYRKALAIKPSYWEAHSNLGNVLKERGLLEDAVLSYRRSLTIKPGHAEVCYNLANTLKDLGRLGEAEQVFLQVLAVRPDFADAYNNLGLVLHAQAKLKDAEAAFRQALSLKPESTEFFTNLLFFYSYTRIISPESECAFAAGWEIIALSEAERAAAQARTFDHPSRSGRKLRIGVVSAEIGQSSVAEFLEPVLESLDHSRCHLVLFSTADLAASSGERVARFKKLADAFISLVGLSDSIAADRIRSERIDILIETTGHTHGSRLGIFAHRAAPVQCHYIGYFGTTGLTEMDWFIADEVLLPSSCDSHFREGIWRLPRIWETYRGDRSLPESRWTPSPDGAVRLGSFNNFNKVREETLHLWSRVMNALPGSILVLKDRKTADDATQQRIMTELSRYGIAGERLEFAAWTRDWRSHMALYDRVDIALDTIPLTSGTTAYDALWMGVPLVALEGDWMGGRMTTSILTALGKPEWIARSAEEYVAVVCALARDVEGRIALRANQRRLMAASPLCDAPGLARALEDAFEAMFDQWQARQVSSRLCREENKEVAEPEAMQGAISVPQAIQSALEHHQAGRLPQAEAIYQNILQIEPHHPDALHLLGVLASQTGQTERAVDLIKRAIHADSSNPYYNYNLATILQGQGKLKEAVDIFNRAISLKPDYAEAHFNLGITLQGLARMDEAVASYRTTLLLDPSSAESHYGIGIILRQENRVAEAVENFRLALKLKPGLVKAHSDLLLDLNYVSGISCAEIHAEHMRYGEIFEEPLRASWQRHGNSPEPERQLKIGYVSGDFRRHAVAFFLEPVLARHDHGQFSIFCYSTFQQDDEVTARLKTCADVWRNVADLTDDELSRLIRKDGIDILVDLSGHTAHNRPLVFGRKPAPVQASWLGYLTTTGLRSMDYRIVDSYTDPPGMSEQYHSEALWRLPDCFVAYRPPPEAPPVRALPAMANGFVTFGSFNNFNKVTPQVMALWSNVLKAVPGSRLLLKTAGLEQSHQRAWVQNAFAAHGIELASLILLGRDADYRQHLDRYGEVDMVLDPFPCNSGTTACEGLWMGVPVITLAGDRFISRMGMSIACNTGLGEWVAQTPEEYIGLALKWSQDVPQLAALRSGLREQLSGSPFFDTERFTRNLEAAYRGMWRSYTEIAER